MTITVKTFIQKNFMNLSKFLYTFVTAALIVGDSQAAHDNHGQSLREQISIEWGLEKPCAVKAAAYLCLVQKIDETGTLQGYRLSQVPPAVKDLEKYRRALCLTAADAQVTGKEPKSEAALLQAALEMYLRFFQSKCREV